MSVFLLLSNGIKSGLWAVQSFLREVHGLWKFTVFLLNQLWLSSRCGISNSILSAWRAAVLQGLVLLYPSVTIVKDRNNVEWPLNSQNKHWIKSYDLALNRFKFSVQQIRFRGTLFNCPTELLKNTQLSFEFLTNIFYFYESKQMFFLK